VDRKEAARPVGREVAVRLNSVEARGVEIIVTLNEVRDAGLTLSEVGELGTGPTMFCPWESYELREVSDEEAVFEPPVEGYREPSARTLERVTPIAQKKSVGGITVAMVSLKIHGNGLGGSAVADLFRGRIAARGLRLRNPRTGVRGPWRLGTRVAVVTAELWWRRGGRRRDGGRAAGRRRSGGRGGAAGRRRLRTWEYMGEGPSREGPWIFRCANGLG